MAVQILRGLYFGRLKTINALPLYGKGIDIRNDAYMRVKLPRSMALRLLSRSILLALIIFTLPTLRTMLSPSPLLEPTVLEPQNGSNFMNSKLFSLLLRDLANEGIYRTGDRAVFIDKAVYDSEIFGKNDIDFISVEDVDRQNMVLDESLDFTFTSGLHIVPEFIDRTLKVGGVAVVQLTDNLSSSKSLIKPSNYKIVYVRQFESTILALRKTHKSNINRATNRRLLASAIEERKAALKNLEDVLLEPPRSASGKSSRYLKRTKYLPDLLGDSLESYPRRVFIDVGQPEKEGGSGTGWFAKNYPTRNLDFEIYKIETVTEEFSGKEVPLVEEVGMSDWMKKNVLKQEYVVMKAEAEVVEEMVKSRAIGLVDELFLECKPLGKGNNVNGRAYWECLALYGMLRDEGIAVHQWWG